MHATNHIPHPVFKRPSQFGLRGDPHLWTELEDLFSTHSISLASDFHFFLVFEIERILGEKLVEGKSIYIERFNQGGMSGGSVSCDFWIKIAIPLLMQQFKEYNPVNDI